MLESLTQGFMAYDVGIFCFFLIVLNNNKIPRHPTTTTTILFVKMAYFVQL
jgi:hypothetical protein